MTDPGDEAECMQASSRGDANERVAVVATLKPGSRERAGAILAQGPPYGIDRAGFRRHSVFLAEETVVFMFEGPGIERLVGDLVNDPARSGGFGGSTDALLSVDHDGNDDTSGTDP